MAKIESTIPDPLKNLVEEYAAVTGQTVSAVVADCIEIGMTSKIEAQNKIYEWRKAKAEWEERQASES